MAPQTRAERTKYEETSRHEDVMHFLAALDVPSLHVETFGTTPGGRSLPIAVLSAHGIETPEEARARALPVVLLIGGIHAGEVEGKEAILMLLRDLASSELLEKLTIVAVPLFNPDGNDALDPANRKLDLDHLSGQCGPLLVGTRVNGAGINLNRDYMRQQAPEMRALQALVAQRWRPELTIDTHATNGSVHRMAMTYDVPHTIASGRAEPILFMRERMMPAVTRGLSARGVTAGWYGNFVEDERALDARRAADPRAPVREGWMTYTHHPRFGSNYRGLTNRLDLLLECYSYLSFEERVHATYATLLEALTFVAANGDDVMQIVASSERPRDRVAVRYALGAFDASITIPTREPRTLDGAPAEVRIPYFASFTGTTVVERPAAYLVPPAVAEHLARHGIASEPVHGELACEVATITAIGNEGGRKILEAAQVGDVTVEWKRAVRSGAHLVRTDHALGAIAVYLCEPESDDGAIENGVVPAPAVGDEYPISRVTDL
ncbi:MAG TPA: M14 family metallopeptidase [Kofleriaceae bacterium]|nr:M14 family metallopeptidase [Kofleriaceae bacterium]